MPPPLTIRPFAEDDDAPARALEERLLRGHRLGLRRARFAARAEQLHEHELLVACRGEERVGTVALAFKPGLLHDRPIRLASAFDLRVAPEAQGAGVGRALVAAAVAAGQKRAQLLTCLAAPGETALERLLEGAGLRPVAGYRTVVVSSQAEGPVSATIRPLSYDEAHEAFLRAQPPFSLYADPRAAGRLDGHIQSWLLEEDDATAGLSVWDNRAVIEEIVEHRPPGLAALARVAAWGPFAHLHPPQLPPAGERLRAWTLFDVHASRPELARELLFFVLDEARAAGIHLLQIPLADQDPLLDALESELPALHHASRPHRLWAGPATAISSPLHRCYLDVREL